MLTDISPARPAALVRTGTDTGIVVGGGAAMVIGLGVMLPIGIVKHTNDNVTTHRITRFDAELYVAKYNRALLRKTIQETKDRMQQLSSKNAPQLQGHAGRLAGTHRVDRDVLIERSHVSSSLAHRASRSHLMPPAAAEKLKSA
jgi:hypothetical protein